jgi:gluconate 5-dehydrogenase
VTGGSRDLGWDAACTLAELGADIVLTSRSLERAEEAVRLLARYAKGALMAHELDVTDKQCVARMFEAAVNRFGRIDVLINNAGGATATDNVDVLGRPLEDWNGVIATNLTGAFLCTQQAGRIMQMQRSGSIVNIASIAALVGRDRRIYEGLEMRPNLPDYSAAKAGLVGFTRECAAALGEYNIRVNAVVPGGFERGQPPEFVSRYSRRTPLGRMGRDRVDIKGIIALLATDAGAYLTGASVVVDGGFSIFK